MAPGARSKFGAPMSEPKVFRKQIHCIEESTCDSIGIFPCPPQSYGDQGIIPSLSLFTPLDSCPIHTPLTATALILTSREQSSSHICGLFISSTEMSFSAFSTPFTRMKDTNVMDQLHGVNDRIASVLFRESRSSEGNKRLHGCTHQELQNPGLLLIIREIFQEGSRPVFFRSMDEDFFMTQSGPQPAWDARKGEDFSERGPKFLNCPYLGGQRCALTQLELTYPCLGGQRYFFRSFFSQRRAHTIVVSCLSLLSLPTHRPSCKVDALWKQCSCSNWSLTMRYKVTPAFTW